MYIIARNRGVPVTHAHMMPAGDLRLPDNARREIVWCVDIVVLGEQRGAAVGLERKHGVGVGGKRRCLDRVLSAHFHPDDRPVFVADTTNGMNLRRIRLEG